MDEAMLAAELLAAPERMTAVELEEVRGGAEPRHDDPVAIYARPYFEVGVRRVAFHREYELATRVPGRLESTASWADAMRADGLPLRLIANCASQLEALVDAERRRRALASTSAGRPMA